jgi:hypothetical protein
MGRPSRHDLRRASFEEFVDFMFDHEVVPVPDDIEADACPWYWNVEVAYQPLRVASYYIRLFTAPGFLPQRYSPAQLEQGFWAIQSGNIECSVAGLIWDARVPFDIRASCVRSMFHLYELLFADIVLESSVDMWWDSLAYDWHCGNRSRARGGEDEAMQDVMFETLSRILALPSVTCQAAALHGLGHLHHPGTSEVILGFLAGNPGMETELRDYALAAARFEVL